MQQRSWMGGLNARLLGCCCSFFFFLLLLNTSSAFRMIPNPGDGKRVLVIGANGRVGTKVVEKLILKGYEVRAMARDTSKITAQGSKEVLSVVQGDVTVPSTLLDAMEGCDACITCHGAARLSKISDLWTDPRATGDLSHPYFTNYKGVVNILEAMKATKCNRLVRVSGLSVGMSAWAPVAILLNTVISMAIRWQWEAEKAIRESGVLYTIVRPGGLTDDERPDSVGLVLRDDGKVPNALKNEGRFPPTPQSIKIGREDVADLMATSLEYDQAKKATLSCLWSKPERIPEERQGKRLWTGWTDTLPRYPQEWKELLVMSEPDRSELTPRAHRKAVLSVVAAVAAVLAGVVTKGVIFVARSLLRALARG